MEFCKTCNGMLMPIDGEQGKLKCISCGNIVEGKIESKVHLHKKKKVQEGIIEGTNDIFATYPHVCKKCGFDKAQIVEREPYLTDEDSLLYLKCGKCGFSENMARKIS